MTKQLYKVKEPGPDMVMPVLMRELNKLMAKGVSVDLMEVYALLHEAQAVYITIHSREQPNAHYKQLAIEIPALLNKYGLGWVLNPDRLAEYRDRRLRAQGFISAPSSDFLMPPKREMMLELDRYDAMQMPQFIEGTVLEDFLAQGIVDIAEDEPS